MTVIAGLKTEDGVWLAADGRASGQDRIFGGTIDKLIGFHVHDAKDRQHLLRAGVAGSATIWSRLRKFVPPLDDPQGSPWDYVAAFVAEAERMFRDADATALIAYRGELFHLDPEGAVLSADRHIAIGMGGGYLLGSLATSEGQGWSPARRLRAGLDAAVQFSKSCGPPFTIWPPDDPRPTVLED